MSRSSIRVLVVDDAASFREAARELLTRRGYVVVGEADCRAAALRAVEQLVPDAVLLDVNLPDADGFELAAELMRTNPQLAVLLTSADQHHDLPNHVPARGLVPKTKLATLDLASFLA